jgi:hypothetical protein
MTRFFINGTDIDTYGVKVLGAKGLFGDLPMKERTIENYPSEHGVLVDRSASLFDRRELSLRIMVYDTSGEAESKYGVFRGLFNSTSPVRLRMDIDFDVYVWDVDFVGESDRSYLQGRRGITSMINLIEAAPIKSVYSVSGSSSSFTIAKASEGVLSRQLVVSHGDGSFSTSRAATVTHTYTDGYSKHYVIISGRMADVTITTDHELLYTISY